RSPDQRATVPAGTGCRTGRPPGCPARPAPPAPGRARTKREMPPPRQGRRRGGRTSESRAGDSLDGFNAARCATAALSYVIARLDPAIHAGSSADATAVFRLALFDLQRQLWTIYAVAASRVGWATNGL